MKSITRFKKNIRGNTCQNCRTHISDEANFCSECGQVNDTNRLSVKQYFSEYLSGFFNFDNRFLKTVIPLIFKPGFVTKEYIRGKRIKYVNPFQLYLHITILFFLVIGIFSAIDSYKSIDENETQLIPKIDLDQGKAELDSIKSDTIDELRKNDVQLDSSTLAIIDNSISNFSTGNDSIQNEYDNRSELQKTMLYSFIDSIVANTEILDQFKDDQIPVAEKDSTMKKLFILISDRAEIITDIDKNMQLNSAFTASLLWQEISLKGNIERQGIKHFDSILDANDINYEIPLKMVYRSKENHSGFDKIKTFMDYHQDYPNSKTSDALRRLGYELTYWNGFLFNKSKEWADAFNDEDYWSEFFERILSRVSVALFFLLPIFTLIVSLLYIRRPFNYTENLVFVFHIQTVFFLLLLIFMFVNRIANSNIGIVIFFLTFMIYLFKAMRNFYGQGWFKTLIKYILLNTSFLILALMGGIVISFLAFMI